MVGSKGDSTLSRRMVSRALSAIAGYSYEERISRLSLNPDRADVIVPALDTFLKVMRWSKAKTIVVPTIGVSDGIIHQLYRRYKQEGVPAQG
jgi:exopolyphosphatase/guanosine-5'-triphosphate,3'-diphosphate pyrophosphatase